MGLIRRLWWPEGVSGNRSETWAPTVGSPFGHRFSKDPEPPADELAAW